MSSSVRNSAISPSSSIHSLISPTDALPTLNSVANFVTPSPLSKRFRTPSLYLRLGFSKQWQYPGASKTGKQLPKVEMPGEDFWKRSRSTQGRRAIEEGHLDDKKDICTDNGSPHLSIPK
ncbi:hypothetical protein TNCV_2776741 [Trichonephila clavipes]|nr:hypothetical protein TNCV_2776741 [Trichonephila clavipes]